MVRNCLVEKKVPLHTTQRGAQGAPVPLLFLGVSCKGMDFMSNIPSIGGQFPPLFQLALL
jgi:hypothetical protein